MNIVFTPIAWEQYTEWQWEDKKMVKRINELIKDIDRNQNLIIYSCKYHYENQHSNGANFLPIFKSSYNIKIVNIRM